MSERDAKPHVEWDEPYASTSFRELFRYSKAETTRTYSLRAVSETEAELWVVIDGRRQGPRSRKLMTVKDPKDVAPLMESIQQELRVGGWTMR